MEVGNDEESSMITKTKSIGTKLIAIIIAGMISMAIAIAMVIGVSGYSNLETITRDNIERSANVITERIASLAMKSNSLIKNINQSGEIRDLLVTETTLSPYYHEKSLSGELVEDADQIYKLQAQLELAKLLRPIMQARNALSVTLYHADAFTPLSSREPSFSLRITKNFLEVAQYTRKDKNSIIASTIPSDDQADYAEFFDISSIYELNLKDFLLKVKANSLRAIPEAPEAHTNTIIDRLIIVDNKPIIQTAAYLNVTIPDPDEWISSSTPAYVLIVEQEINQEDILILKELVNADIALLVEGELLISTLAMKNFLYSRARKIVSTSEDFFVAERKVAFSAEKGDLREMGVLVMSPVSSVEQLNLQLFIQVFIVILCSTLLVCVFFFVAVNRIINTPLSRLLEGVENLSYGEIDHDIKIESDDELGRLARSFNAMSEKVHKKSSELKISHAELEKLLDEKDKELESTQVQLIEAEKMSSLGELVAGVSHEVSTPIGICITAESFFHDETHEIQAKFNSGSMSRQDFTAYMTLALENGSILNANLGRTAELIKNFKQIAVDQCIEDMRSITVIQYIENLLSTLKPRIKSLKHIIKVHGDDKVEITSYPGAIAQVITNLIMNSIIHGFDDTDEGNISIEISAKDGGISLIYKDDGKGMSAQAQEKIFDPFFTTRKGKGGTGLGMNIVYKLITDTLKGSIKCSSQLGQGIKFDIIIADQEI